MASYRRIVGGFLLALWLISILLPVETDCGSPHPAMGYVFLLMGWLGVFDGQIGWFANPFLLWVMGRLLFDRRPEIIPALIGLGLALTALAWKTTPRGDAPGNNTICSWDAGFYLWIVCAVLLAMVALVEPIRHRAGTSERGSS